MMPSIGYDALVHWSNYHLTIGKREDLASARSLDDLVPSMVLGDAGRIHTADIERLEGLERFAETARCLFAHLARFETQAERRNPLQPGEPMVGMTGRGWSFSQLIGTEFSQLDCSGLSSVATLPEAHAAGPAANVVLCGGGTRLREIVAFAEPELGLTVETSGTHLGLTLAGAAGTASHGSRLGLGGMQNSVLGMHLVTGPGEHVWIEDPETPALSPEGRAALEIPGARLRFIQSRTKFEDALIHLGAMGIVNGIALRMAPNATFAEMRRRAKIDKDWLEALSEGRFPEIAARLGCDEAPVFYELTIDPHDPFDNPAAHICYFEANAPAGSVPQSPLPRTADAFAEYADFLGENVKNLIPSHKSARFAGKWIEPASSEEIAAIRHMLRGEASGFEFYADNDEFEPNTLPFDPDGSDVRRGPWSALHPDEITGGVPGSLYNASFSIERGNLARAIPAICDAVRDLPPTFVFTVRFVSNPRGTLAFTRFNENAVIEIDGLSPLICNIFALQAHGDPNAPEARLFALLAPTVETGARAVREALGREKIDYSMHWAKLGELDPAKVDADFGGSSPGDTSLIERWRTTRFELLGTKWARWFVNPEIKRLGLVP
jgi:hypothetical protein